MPDLDSLHFDHDGWQAIESKPHIRVWGDDIRSLSSVLSLEYFDKPPEIAVSLKDINSIRFIYRDLANQSGAGLIFADTFIINGTDCIETIFKMRQANRGIVYIGSLTIPFAQFSYVVKVQTVEIGFTGVREAVVYNQLLDTAQFDADGKIANWEKDPYDPNGAYPFMPNMAEAIEYDAMFPQHALSRVRETMKSVRETIAFSDELRGASRFDSA